MFVTRWPLALRIVIAVLLGAAVGATWGKGEIALGLRPQHLGELGLLVIRLLKALAVPLIFFAVVDALLKTSIRGRQGLRLVAICLVNVSVAFAIGLTLMNVFEPGLSWQGHFDELLGVAGKDAKLPSAQGVTLSPLRNVDGYVPVSLLDPFVKNVVISVVLLSLFTGIALRHVRARRLAAGEGGIEAMESVVSTGFETLVLMLAWVIEIVPFAVFGVVAQVVGHAGLAALQALWIFLAVILAGLLIHSLVYYPLVAWLVGRKPPSVYLGKGADAILTGLSTNSSLATVPVTLRSLDRMGVSPPSARLAALIGTNLNNDGITLYDAMAALFIAQAVGVHLDLQQQAVIVMAALMAGMGVAGIPEAGLIVLPLVLTAAGLPESVVAAAIPLVIPVDWILARVRSGVNVMSDMLVAILLDRFDSPPAVPRTVDQPAA